MTEQLLEQQLESPSGTGRVEPRSQIRLSGPATNERDTTKPTPHSHWQLWWLFAIIAVLHAAYAGLVTIRNGSLDLGGTGVPRDGADPAVRWVIAAWPGWTILLVLVVAMIIATAPNSKESQLNNGAKKYGLIHGAAQAALFVAVAAFGRWVGPQTAWWHFIVVPLIGGILSTALFVGMVRWTNSHIKANDTLAFSSAHLTRYKQFLRMCIETDGTLSVYAVGLDPVGCGWFDALTTKDATIPPFDSAGAPRLHYVWGKRFPATQHATQHATHNDTHQHDAAQHD